jgi:hypothetical protein
MPSSGRVRSGTPLRGYPPAGSHPVPGGSSRTFRSPAVPPVHVVTGDHAARTLPDIRTNPRPLRIIEN